MLAIRMQRTGRSGHAQFRVIVQDSHRSPTSGKIVAYLGSYDPHNKTAIIDKQKVAFYLEHGAQPSDRLARLLKSEGVSLPAWVSISADKERTVRNADKRRSTRPAGEAAPPPAEEPAAESETAEIPAIEEAKPVEETTLAVEAPAEEPPAAEPEASAEKPADQAE